MNADNGRTYDMNIMKRRLVGVCEASFGFNDALNGDNRPDGANGVETEFPPADPRYVEGPLGGLLVNGPLG